MVQVDLPVTAVPKRANITLNIKKSWTRPESTELLKTLTRTFLFFLLVFFLTIVNLVSATAKQSRKPPIHEPNTRASQVTYVT